jgi:hypothetical protein
MKYKSHTVCIVHSSTTSEHLIPVTLNLYEILYVENLTTPCTSSKWAVLENADFRATDL